MLGTLPPELLAQIVSLLEVPDLSSLRLTSRQLERPSTESLSATVFSTIRVSFGVDNLRWVSNVAGHEDFRLAVRCVRIGKWETGARDSYEMGYGVGGYWPRQEDGRVDRQSELVQQFVDCLSRFPNCASIIVTDERILYTYSQHYRGPDRHLSSADAVDLALYALSASRLSSLRSFQTRIVQCLDWYPEGSITLPDAASVDKGIADNLEELTLELRAEDPKPIASLLHLVAAAPRLAKLRLFLTSNTTADDGYGGSLISQHIDTASHSTPRLDTLLLGCLMISEAGLLRLISGSCDTMKRVDFHSVTLTSGSWTSVLENLHIAPFRQLQWLSMFHCREGSSDATVAFCPLWKSGRADELPDVSFGFKVASTARSPVPRFHLTGALFESRGGNSGTAAALRAMVENSHMCPGHDDPGPQCGELRELKLADENHRGTVTFFERWTGLSL